MIWKFERFVWEWPGDEEDWIVVVVVIFGNWEESHLAHTQTPKDAIPWNQRQHCHRSSAAAAAAECSLNSDRGTRALTGFTPILHAPRGRRRGFAKKPNDPRSKVLVDSLVL